MVKEFHGVQKLAMGVQEAWEFLSDPRNLATITPPSMEFAVLSEYLPEKMYPGLIIAYRVRPMLRLPLRWVTEITHVREPEYFVDEQRFGPYTFWHHKHFIRAIPGGVEMEDLIHYKVPGGPVGRWLAPWLVEPKLKEIFAYRRKQLADRFGEL